MARSNEGQHQNDGQQGRNDQGQQGQGRSEQQNQGQQGRNGQDQQGQGRNPAQGRDQGAGADDFGRDAKRSGSDSNR